MYIPKIVLLQTHYSEIQQYIIYIYIYIYTINNHLLMALCVS
jgi:hypothetical protein